MSIPLASAEAGGFDPQPDALAGLEHEYAIRVTIRRCLADRDRLSICESAVLCWLSPTEKAHRAKVLAFCAKAYVQAVRRS